MADPNEAAKSKEGRALEDRSALVSEAEAARFKERNATTGHRFAVTHWRSEKDSNPRYVGFYPGGFRPEFGALFDPNKSIRAGENLFACGSVLLRTYLFPSSPG